MDEPVPMHTPWEMPLKRYPVYHVTVNAKLINIVPSLPAGSVLWKKALDLAAPSLDF